MYRKLLQRAVGRIGSAATNDTMHNEGMLWQLEKLLGTVPVGSLQVPSWLMLGVLATLMGVAVKAMVASKTAPLVLRAAGPSGSVAPVAHGLVVGRSMLGITDKSVGEQHCVIRGSVAGTYELLPQAPRSVTVATGQRVVLLDSRSAPYAIQAGDRIFLGRTQDPHREIQVELARPSTQRRAASEGSSPFERKIILRIILGLLLTFFVCVIVALFTIFSDTVLVSAERSDRGDRGNWKNLREGR